MRSRVFCSRNILPWPFVVTLGFPFHLYPATKRILDVCNCRLHDPFISKGVIYYVFFFIFSWNVRFYFLFPLFSLIPRRRERERVNTRWTVSFPRLKKTYRRVLLHNSLYAPNTSNWADKCRDWRESPVIFFFFLPSKEKKNLFIFSVLCERFLLFIHTILLDVILFQLRFKESFVYAAAYSSNYLHMWIATFFPSLFRFL